MMWNLQVLIKVIVFLLFPLSLWAGDILYVDPYTGSAPMSPASWDGVDGHEYTGGTPGAGVGYSTVNAALDAQGSGDDIYIRGGTYQESQASPAYAILKTASGSSEDWSSIQSYPGEWAILDAEGVSICLGIYAAQEACPAGAACLSYYTIERLEIKNAISWGIAFAGGPVKVRYCYVHDNVSTGIDNPSGIYVMRPTDCIFEYNFLEDNGSTSASSHENCTNFQTYSAQACTSGTYHAENEPFLTTGLAYTSERLRNIIRYNRIVDNDDRANWGIKHKAGTVIMPHATDGAINETWAEWGDKIHHNIVTGGQGIEIEQDVAQVYNNIVPGGQISIGYKGDFTPVFCVTYNNYSFNLVYSIVTPISGNDYYFWEPSTSTLFRKDWSYNNITDSRGSNYVETYQEITFGYYTPSGYDAETVLDLDDFYFQNNYLYRPDDSDDVYNSGLSSDGHGNMTLTAWESAYTNVSSNYEKASSEETDSLFAGSTGADAYKIKSTHVITGETTIANGGVGSGSGISHPYISGVTIPGYVGPCKPNDDGWVDGVLALDATYFTSATAGSDPSWIEGSGSSPAVSGNGVGGSGVSNSGGG